MRIIGTAGFPASWQGKRYTLSMSIGRSTVLQSSFVNVPPASSNTVDVTVMFLMLPDVRTTSVDIPFMWAGDFNWILILGSSRKLHHSMPVPPYWDLELSLTACIWMVIASDMIRAARASWLERCWVRAPPNGPLAGPNPTRVDVSPFSYPILLWRLFVPNLVEYNDDPTLPSLTVQFYIRRGVGIVWNTSSNNPQYDTFDRRTYYVESYLRRVIILQRGIELLFGEYITACVIFADESPRGRACRFPMGLSGA